MRLTASYTSYARDLVQWNDKDAEILAEISANHIPSITKLGQNATLTLFVEFSDEYEDYGKARNYLIAEFKRLGVEENLIRFDLSDIAGEP